MQEFWFYLILFISYIHYFYLCIMAAYILICAKLFILCVWRQINDYLLFIIIFRNYCKKCAVPCTIYNTLFKKCFWIFLNICTVYSILSVTYNYRAFIFPAEFFLGSPGVGFLHSRSAPRSWLRDVELEPGTTASSDLRLKLCRIFMSNVLTGFDFQKLKTTKIHNK